MSIRSAIVLLLLLLASCADRARFTPSTRAGYGPRQGFIEEFVRTRRFTLGRPSGFQLTPNGSHVLYLRSAADSFVHDLYEMDVHSGTERILAAAARLLEGGDEQLSPEEKARRERMRVTTRGFASFEMSRDGERVLAPLSGRLFVIERVAGTVIELPSDGGPAIDPHLSPDGTKVACVREGELHVIDIATRRQQRITSGASEHITHGLAEFVAQEEMGRFSGYWWSPDSRFIAYQRNDTSVVERFHIMDGRRPEVEPQANPYPRAGKPNADVKLGIIPAEGGDTTWATWDRAEYPYLATVRWSQNAPLTVLVQNRRQTDELLLSIDPSNGAATTLLREQDNEWLNLDQKMPLWLAGGESFLWVTERNGTEQLELRSRDGAMRRSVTPVTFRLREFGSISEDGSSAIVLGGDDPTQIHLFRLSLTGQATEPVQLTSDVGIHGAVFSRDGRFMVHTASTLNAQQGGSDFWRATVRNADFNPLAVIPSAARRPDPVPMPEFVEVGRSPSLHTVITRPATFRSGKKYPVLVYVYGGPGSQTVMKSAYAYLLQQWLADHGFIVVSIDGRGTPGRGRDWERSIKRDVIEIPMGDQITGLRELGRQYKEMDLNRVGIYGWSFGGYFSAMAVMRHPEVFHAGVAGAPVCDWLDYDTHYTERYMDLPDMNPDGYRRTSVATNAPDLSRPLLIMHGTMDDNVYFMHALKMSHALHAAGVEHEFLPLSEFTHMLADPNMTRRVWERLANFFVERLQ